MMTIPTHLTKFAPVNAISLVIALTVTACSDEPTPQKNQSTAKIKTEHNPFDHSHDIEVTDVQKHKFEHDFAEQCVRRELEHSTNKAEDEERWRKPCLCIATYLMKDLTADEAGKFIDEHKNTQSLVIKYENAAFHCLQEKTQAIGPKLFGKP